METPNDVEIVYTGPCRDVWVYPASALGVGQVAVLAGFVNGVYAKPGCRGPADGPHLLVRSSKTLVNYLDGDDDLVKDVLVRDLLPGENFRITGK